MAISGGRTLAQRASPVAIASKRFCAGIGEYSCNVSRKRFTVSCCRADSDVEYEAITKVMDVGRWYDEPGSERRRMFGDVTIVPTR